ncbi:MAG: hypothetical protein B6A08_05890 [Sorangiineae bacterium NIC37A_2]|jgi:hypothetical protein|nr:MAG: hypothetical protein B6A08_05890 [Sorangiineae bacterium NIC37A_2]
MKNLHSTQFESAAPLSDEELEQELHWLTYSITLRALEKEPRKSDRTSRPRALPWTQLWAPKLGG